MGVIIEGGIGEERSDEQDDLSKTIMIARKNLIFACTPSTLDSDSFPSLSLAPALEEESPIHHVPSEVLGDVWYEPSTLPAHLQSPDALIWLTALMGRLIVSK